MEPVIHLRAVVSLLGRFPALAGIDLDVGPGEVVVLHGANGAGKTTLLRVCAGLVGVAEGTAVVLGHDLTVDRRGVRARVGLLGHGSGLYEEMTVDDNVTFWARAAGARAADVEAALSTLGLGGRLRHVRVGLLSAGQRRRTSLACLVARRPELWLLDEPHAGLDAEGRDLLDELVAGASAAGATVLAASHEHDRTARLSSRVVTLGGGVVLADSSPPGDTGRPGSAGPLERGVTGPPVAVAPSSRGRGARRAP